VNKIFLKKRLVLRICGGSIKEMIKTYAELSKGKKANFFVRRAFKLLNKAESALDVGAGSLRNTKFLLEKGLDVTALDLDPIILEAAAAVNNERLTASVADITKFEYSNKYDLVLSINVLSFLTKGALLELLPKLKNSLAQDGILCVTLFGVSDEWAHKENMSFFDCDEAKALFDDMNLVVFIEEESEGTLIQGGPKHWHLFRIIAKNK